MVAPHDMYELDGIRYRRDDLEALHNGVIPEGATLIEYVVPAVPVTKADPGIISTKQQRTTPANKAG